MSVRESMNRFRAFLVDVAGAVLDQVKVTARWIGKTLALVGGPVLRLLKWLGSITGTWASSTWSSWKPGLTEFASGVSGVARGAARHMASLLRSARRPVALAAVGTLIVLGVGRATFHRVPAETIAVRQSEWGGGVIQEDHGPGLHFSLFGRDAWHHLPMGTHVINFAWDNEGGTEEILSAATREGESAQVAAFVPYRIRPGSGWRLVSEGMRGDYPTRAVAICRRVLLEELGTLSSSELIDPEARARVASAALERLDGELGATHLEPLDVRLGTTFFNPTFEKKLLEKQLADQGQLTAASLAARTMETRSNKDLSLEIERAEADEVAGFARRAQEMRDESAALIAAIKRAATQEAQQEHSRTEVAVLELQNEAALALSAAEDLRESLFSRAQNSDAGRLYVASLAAKNLNIDRVVLDASDAGTPSIIDLDELVGLLLGK